MTLAPRTSLSTRFNKAQAQLVIQTADLPLGTLAEMVENKAIDMEPSFQRRERWNVDKQSALIESFLLNVPVPPIYLAEERSGKYSAIDGKQRLRAIADFVKNRIALRNLERLTEAQGYRVDDLPDEIRNSLNLRPYLRVVTLLKQTDKTLKYEVFMRLNRGGERLNAQEIRNVAFRGQLNDLVCELGLSTFLREQLKITDVKSSSYAKMEDAEFVLRFLTLNERFGQFSGSFVREMDDFAEKYQNAANVFIKSQRDAFETALERCQLIWQQNAFKRPDKGAWRDQFLVGMYDAQMLAVSRLTNKEASAAIRQSKAALSKTKRLFGDQDFDEAVRTGTNTPKRIESRVQKVLVLLKSL